MVSNDLKAQSVNDQTLGASRRQRKTAVEQLDTQYPGLQEFVDGQLSTFVPVQEIAKKVQQKFGIRVPERTLGSYRQRRWAVARRRIEDEKLLDEVVRQLKKTHGEEEVSRMVPFLRERLSLQRMSPAELLRELRQRSRRDIGKVKSEQDLKSRA
jgi:hypothetical protein